MERIEMVEDIGLENINFVDVLDDIKKTPVEDKIQELGMIVEKLIQIMLNVSDLFEKEIKMVKKQVQIGLKSQSLIEVTEKPKPLPTRKMINDELKAIFKKNKLNGI